jgi:hypothetical protein
MTRAKRIAISLRWILLSFWVLCLVCGLIWLFGVYFDFGAGMYGTPAIVLFGPFYQIFDIEIFDNAGEWKYVPIVLIYTGLFFFTQWLFLSPRKLWKIKTRITGRPMKKAAIGAAFVIAILFAGLGYSILDLFSIEILYPPPSKILEYLLISVPLMLWVFWSIIFCVYFRQVDYYTWAGRIIRGLVAGSVLELFVSIPIFATRQDDCYCARGSYAGIVFGATVLLWAFGPGVFLLFLREKHRIEKLDAIL